MQTIKRDLLKTIYIAELHIGVEFTVE